MSLARSMNILTKDFLKSYEWDMSKYLNKEEIVNDLFFYWLRNSADKHYLWCEELGSDVFSEEFANEMKVTLYIVYCRYSLKHELKQDKKKRKHSM